MDGYPVDMGNMLLVFTRSRAVLRGKGGILPHLRTISLPVSFLERPAHYYISWKGFCEGQIGQLLCNSVMCDIGVQSARFRKSYHPLRLCFSYFRIDNGKVICQKYVL